MSGRKRWRRRGIGTVLATIIFVFIVIFMTANLIVWGIVQSADLQSVINQMTQRDQQQASENLSVPSTLFGGTHKYTDCVVGTASGCSKTSVSSGSGQATTSLVSNMNFTSSTSGWAFTRILAPGTSSGIAGGFDAGGTEVGAVGSPSGPGMVYMGVSFFPTAGTATYSATWSNKFYVDLSNYGIPSGKSFSTYSKCSGPNCQIIGSWAWILPRVNPGVVALTVKFEIADSSASGTSCSPPHCYVMDQQTYTTLADQTWNYRKVTWGGFSTTGTASGGTTTTLTVSGSPWTVGQWANYLVTINSGTDAGQSRLILNNTVNTLTLNSTYPFTAAPTTTSQFTISLSGSGTSTCGSSCTTTLTDTSQNWYTNEWTGYYVSISTGTGTGQTLVVKSNNATTLTFTSAWTTPPDSTSQYVIGCPANNFCDWDVRSLSLDNEVQTTYSPAFWGTSGSPGYYTVQMEADFTLSQSSNPSEVRIVFDDSGLAFRTPSHFAATGAAGGGSATVIDIPLTNGENPSLISQLTISTATAFSAANIQEASYIRDYTTGLFVPLSSGLVSQQTVNSTSTFTGSEVQRYIGTQTNGSLQNEPAAAVFDTSGNLWVADQHNNRVLEYSAANIANNNPNATLVIGQSSSTASSSATTASGLSSPTGLAFDSYGNLWVADTGNNRVLRFGSSASSGSPPTFTSGMSASLVVGQSTFTSSASSTSATGFTGPDGVAFDSSGNLWVADTGNNRVLEFAASKLTSSNPTATLVIGESSFTVSAPSSDSGTATSGTTTTLTDTAKTWSTNQWVNGYLTITSGTDSGQHSYVASNTADTLTLKTALTTAIDSTSVFTITPSATTVANLNAPTAAAFDQYGNLWVVDGGSNRVLKFGSSTTTNTPPTFSNGMSASTVVGQSSFTTSGSATNQSRLSGPTSLGFYSGNLWVADSGNNRVLEFASGSLSSNNPSASTVIGQWGYTTNTAGTNESRLDSPYSVAFDSGGNLWVSDRTNDRTLKFASLTSDSSASVVIGQSSFTVSAHPNIEIEFTATNPSSFSVKTMAASVQDFYRDVNHITVQVTNNWASTSHIVDVFVTDASGTHCFTRVPEGCAASLLSAVSATSQTSTATVSGTTLTDSSGKQGTWVANQWKNSGSSASYNFVYIMSGDGAGSYGSISGNIATSSGTSTVSVSSWVGTAPSGTVTYLVGQTWAGLYVAPGTTGVITLPYTWSTGPVTIKVTSDLGNTIVFSTIAS